MNSDSIVHYSAPKIKNEGNNKLNLVSSVGFHMTVCFKQQRKAVKEHGEGRVKKYCCWRSEVFREKEICREGGRESSRMIHVDSSTAFGHKHDFIDIT